MKDGVDRNLITGLVGGVLVVLVLGLVTLALIEKPIPDELPLMAGTCLGILGGALLPRSNGADPP